MAQSPVDIPFRHFAAPDGVRLAWREVGEGRPVVLIHGLFSNGWTNWIRYGHAAVVAARGFRVILPDLRGHGDSEAPEDASGYPPDVLATDGEALIRHLGLSEYDLGGYSLGGRTTVRMLVRGARPGRAVVCGMGLDGLLHTGGRGGFFRKVLAGYGGHPRGSAEWLAEAFLRTTGGSPDAMMPLLESFVDTTAAEIAAIATPTLVASGVEDQDNGSSEDLAAALGDARYVAVPGNHMSAVAKPELGGAIATFLDRNLDRARELSPK